MTITIDNGERFVCVGISDYSNVVDVVDAALAAVIAYGFSQQNVEDYVCELAQDYNEKCGELPNDD